MNLSDCKLKTDINNVINALGSNQCLQVILMREESKVEEVEICNDGDGDERIVKGNKNMI